MSNSTMPYVALEGLVLVFFSEGLFLLRAYASPNDSVRFIAIGFIESSWKRAILIRADRSTESSVTRN